MNSVELVGRLTRDPDVRYTSDGKAVAHFTVAVDRDGMKDEDGRKIADYPNIVAFGRVAETCETYLKKGRQVGVQGRIQTGSYKNKNGDTVYTTEVVASRIGLIGSAPAKPEEKPQRQEQFEEIDDDVPF